MELTEDELNEKDGKKCRHFSRNTLLPSEFGSTCFWCNYNVVKRKSELVKFQKKEIY